MRHRTGPKVDTTILPPKAASPPLGVAGHGGGVARVEGHYRIWVESVEVDYCQSLPMLPKLRSPWIMSTMAMARPRHAEAASPIWPPVRLGSGWT